jgi:uncharacterized membrane protein YcaP (DUF421 family)
MAELFDMPDWQELFIPTVPLLETFIRGSLMYLALFALMRFILKRESGSLGITDLLVLVLLSEASQNALASNYKSITDGVLLVTVIIFWSHALNWLGFKFPVFQKLIKPSKLLLIRNGRMIYENMKEELITEEELLMEMRTNGVSDIKDVSKAYMEGNGKVSIICKPSSKKKTETVSKSGQSTPTV